MPWDLRSLNLASEGSEEVQMMSSEGEMRERERRAWRTALPILPVVPVRASILILCFLGGGGCLYDMMRCFGLVNRMFGYYSPTRVFIAYMKSTIIINSKHHDILLWGFMGRIEFGDRQ